MRENRNISNWKCYRLAVFNNVANLVYGVDFSCSFHGAIAEWIDWINWLNWLIATSRHLRPHDSSLAWQIRPHVTRLTDSPFHCWHDACPVTYSSRFRFRLRMISATRGKSRRSVLENFLPHDAQATSMHSAVCAKTWWAFVTRGYCIETADWIKLVLGTHTHCRQYYTVLTWSTIQNQVQSLNNASSRMYA